MPGRYTCKNQTVDKDLNSNELTSWLNSKPAKRPGDGLEPIEYNCKPKKRSTSPTNKGTKKLRVSPIVVPEKMKNKKSNKKSKKGGRKTWSKRQTGGTNNNMNIVLASHDGNREIVENLLNDGVDVDERYRGFTALIKASQQGHTEIVKMLLENGANVNAKDTHGDTALDKAKNIQPWRTYRPNTEENSEVVNLLTNAEKVRDNKQKAMEQVEGRVRKVPSLHALAHKELNTNQLYKLNKYNIFPTRKKLGGKRRTRKSKRKGNKKSNKKYM